MRILKTLLFLLCLSGGGVPVLAAPQLVPERLNYDFGEVVQGDQVEFTFRFRNAGDEILQISNVRSSCGCTAALLSSRRIGPGEMGEVQAKFDSTQFRGGVTKTISLETNDPQQPELSFSLYGQVKAELVMTPDRIRWGQVSGDDPLQAVVQIVNQGKIDVTLQPPRATSPELSVSLSDRHLPAGGEVQLQVSGRFPEGKSRLGGYVIILTDHPKAAQLRLPVAARRAD